MIDLFCRLRLRGFLMEMILSGTQDFRLMQLDMLGL